MSKIKSGGLDQYGAGPFEQQQFGTAGNKGVKMMISKQAYCQQISSKFNLLHMSKLQTKTTRQFVKIQSRRIITEHTAMRN